MRARAAEKASAASSRKRLIVDAGDRVDAVERVDLVDAVDLAIQGGGLSARAGLGFR